MIQTSQGSAIEIDPLREQEAEEAWRLGRLAFGTFLGLPVPDQFMGDRDMVGPRVRSSNVRAVAARENGRLIGSNVATHWGSFGFFGPLTIHPDYWERKTAQLLLKATDDIFASWDLRYAGLFTFSHSPKHIGLYGKFGYYPRFLTPVFVVSPEEQSGWRSRGASGAAQLSGGDERQRSDWIGGCRELTDELYDGLDLSEEIESVLRQGVGEVLLLEGNGKADGFAICMHGRGSEGGERTCYVKFAAARSGAGAAERFERLLDACESYAFGKGLMLEAGVNLSHEDAYRRMRARGYRGFMQGVALHRPNQDGFCRSETYVMDDWR